MVKQCNHLAGLLVCWGKVCLTTFRSKTHRIAEHKNANLKHPNSSRLQYK